jgi:hypothetical protein
VLACEPSHNAKSSARWKSGEKDLTKRALEKCFYSFHETEAEVRAAAVSQGPECTARAPFPDTRG